MPLDSQSVVIFDEILHYFNWPKHEDNTILEKLADTNNFNPSNYKLAISCYMNWCEQIYPNVAPQNQESFKLAFAQQALNILHAHAPNHHVHKALNEQ